MNTYYQPRPNKASMTRNERVLHQFGEVAEAEGISPLTIDWSPYTRPLPISANSSALSTQA